MTWIKTVPFAEADEKLRGAIERQRSLYPPEYGPPTAVNPDDSAGVVAAHSLIPDACTMPSRPSARSCHRT
jgi:hypothetical protein